MTYTLKEAEQIEQPVRGARRRTYQKRRNRMILTEDQRSSFEEAAKPMIKWLCENCHPHVTAIIEPDRAELHEGVCSIPCNEFIKD